MTIGSVSTEAAPQAIGPYSQAITHGDLIFTAGQICLDPAGQLVGAGVAEQTTQVLSNLRAVLAAAGSDLSRVLKTTVYLTDMADFAAMNGEYAKAFGDHRPARSTVAVSGLPRGVKIEIDVVAVRG